MGTGEGMDELLQPQIVSMEVDDENSCESGYRLQIGNQIKYLVNPGTYDRDTLSFPLADLPSLQYDANWTHPTTIDYFDLEKTEQLTAAAYEAVPSPALASILGTSHIIAKIARFEWEIPRLEQETRIYRLLSGSGLTPRFLGHIREGDRVIGFVLEKVAGRAAGVEDLEACRGVLGRLHGMGVVHGDVNRFNFLVGEGGAVRIIDFERAEEGAGEERRRGEIEGLGGELGGGEGRGGGVYVLW
ncbi:hypothetical protein VE02_08411 [Pseudogymnoascus sp. 03VT05]|nr:hypothetical protein VE02_08411 [Pseudogymnoascus sp. 03VT05]